jgi:DNA-binding XRE family transcriptional regulator
VGTKRQDERAARIADEVRLYVDEMLPIREVAVKAGVSYGVAHRDLAQAGVAIRGSWTLDPEGAPESGKLAYARTQMVCRLLREAREAQMTQGEAARRLGMWAPTLSRLERGRREAYPLPLLVAYAEVLGLKLSDILARAEELVPSESEPEEHDAT